MAITEEAMQELDKKFGLQPTNSPSNYNTSRLNELKTIAAEKDAKDRQVSGGVVYDKDIPVVKQLSDFGVGVGSAVGKLGIGAMQGASKLVGGALPGLKPATSKFSERLGEVKKQVYDDSFAEQKSSVSGKTGEVVGNIAPYMATAGIVNPATANLPRFAQILARTAPDIAIAFGQSGGDAKTTGVTGVTSAIANAILPGSAQATKLFSKEGIKQFGKEVSTGYVGDVATGMAGLRGEEREGAKAFIPGAGTALAGGFGLTTRAIGKGQELFTEKGKERAAIQNAPKVIENRKKELESLANKYPSLKNTVAKGKERGVDIIDMASKSSLLDGAVDSNGNLIIKGEDGAIARLNKELEPFESVVYDNLVREGNKIKFDLVKKQINKNVENSGLMGKALLSAEDQAAGDIAGYARLVDKDGYIPVADIHRAKVSKYANLNYENEASKQADKAIAKGLKTLVEDHTSSVDVKEINKELKKLYSFQDFLEKLDNKKVEGGRLGKYFQSAVGGLVGSSFGPFGTILGAELGSKLKGVQMKGKFGGTTGSSAIDIPDVLKQAEVTAKSPRLGLPAPTIKNRSEVYSGKPIEMGTKLPDEAQALPASQAYSRPASNINQQMNANSDSMKKMVPDVIDAVNKGLEDPTLAALYDDAPEEFVDEMKGFIIKTIDLPETATEAKMIEAIPNNIGFKKFGEMVKKLLGGDLPNKQGGFAKVPLFGGPKDVPASVTPQKVAKMIDQEDLIAINEYLKNDNMDNYMKLSDLFEGTKLNRLSFKDLRNFLEEVADIKTLT